MADTDESSIRPWVKWKRKFAWGDGVRLLLAFSPAIVLVSLIARHSVNTPVWDDWERVPLIEKAEAGELTFRDLYAPHIDHRIFFPRLLILGLNGVTEGDLRWEVGLVFLFGLLAGIGIFQLVRQTFRDDGTGIPWLVLFAANLVIFSPIQWQNWLWAIQTAMMLPMTCLIWALVILNSRWPWWGRLLGCLGLALVSTHSFGHGIFIWPAVLVAAVLRRSPEESGRTRPAFIGVWILGAALVLGAYFLADFNNISHASHSYGQEVGETPPAAAHWKSSLGEPVRLGTYVGALLGNPFSRFHGIHPLNLAAGIGFGLLTAFAAAGIWAVVRWKDRDLWNRAVPWLTLGGTVVVISAAIALGRLEAGPVGMKHAIQSRYMSYALYLPIALLFLGVLMTRSVRRKENWPETGKAAGIFAIGMFAGLQVFSWIYGARMMRLYEWSRYQGQAELIFIEFWDPDVPERIDATVGFPRRGARFLDEAGFLDPPLVKSLDLAQFRPTSKSRPQSQAVVETFQATDDDTFRISGYGFLIGDGGRRRPADAVLLCHQVHGEPSSRPVIFALAAGGRAMARHPYLTDLGQTGRTEGDPLDPGRWEERFERSALPEGKEIVVTAWLFDVKKSKAYRVAGKWVISDGGDVREMDERARAGE